jgi:hypothetical protein
MRSGRFRVLRDPIAERPILFLHFDQIDEDIGSADAELGFEPSRERVVEPLLGCGRAAFVERDLDDYDVVVALDAEVVRIVDEPIVR